MSDVRFQFGKNWLDYLPRIDDERVHHAIGRLPVSLACSDTVGYGRSQKNYGAVYRSVQEALKPELPRNAETTAQAHLLLRQHGKEICRDKSPQCYVCPVKGLCVFAKADQNFQPRCLTALGGRQSLNAAPNRLPTSERPTPLLVTNRAKDLLIWMSSERRTPPGVRFCHAL
jgi:hypothetical protein